MVFVHSVKILKLLWYNLYLCPTHGMQPMMAYTQRTWKAASGEPMHAESGFFRPKPDGSIEAVIAQSTGLAEVQVMSPLRLSMNASVQR